MNKVHPTFERLMQAASALKGITSQAELARETHTLDQHITNWKRRGVPKKNILELADEWGFRTKWLMHGEGEMTVNYIPRLNSPEAMVLKAMQQMDEITKYQVVKISNSLTEPETNGHTPPQHTGTHKK